MIAVIFSWSPHWREPQTCVVIDSGLSCSWSEKEWRWQRWIYFSSVKYAGCPQCAQLCLRQCSKLAPKPMRLRTTQGTVIQRQTLGLHIYISRIRNSWFFLTPQVILLQLVQGLAFGNHRSEKCNKSITYSLSLRSLLYKQRDKTHSNEANLIISSSVFK